MLDANQPKIIKAFEWFVHQNKIDESKRLIGLHVSNNLLFYIAECKTPKEVWEKLSELYGKVNRFKILQLEADLTSLSSNVFPNISDFLAYFKLILSQLKGCDHDKFDIECIFLLLSKLRGDFQVFSYTFYFYGCHGRRL